MALVRDEILISIRNRDQKKVQGVSTFIDTCRELKISRTGPHEQYAVVWLDLAAVS
jgi:hypothetical protein